MKIIDMHTHVYPDAIATKAAMASTDIFLNNEVMFILFLQLVLHHI